MKARLRLRSFSLLRTKLAAAGIRSGQPEQAAGNNGFRRARWIGLERNAFHLQLLCTAINLKRALVLAA